MKTIWRHSPQVCAGRQLISMPENAVFVDAQMVSGGVRMWMAVDDDVPMEPHAFHFVETGAPLPTVPDTHYLKYRRTLVTLMEYVLHLFEEVKV